MSYQRKTKDRWDIMTNWGYGWEYGKAQRADHSIILGGI